MSENIKNVNWEEIPMNKKVCFLVRHGERLDEVRGTRWSDKWFQENPHRYPLDPPLTKNGQGMAKQAANTFLENHNHDLEILGLTCIYSSPLHRTLLTAYEFAKALKLPIIIVPGLACTAAAMRYGPIIEKPGGTLALKQRVGQGENVFLTCEEMRELCPQVNISIRKDLLGGIYLHDFENVVLKLAEESKGRAFMCVGHREGIRHFQGYFDKHWRAHYCHTCRIFLDLNEENKVSKIEPEYSGTPRMK